MIIVKIKITAVGVLNHILPKNKEIIEVNEHTVRGVLDILMNKYGKPLAEELLEEGRLKDDLSILVNGRNILSMPNKFQTVLKDNDEIIITAYITGG